MLVGRKERTRGLAGVNRSVAVDPALCWRCHFDRASDGEAKVKASQRRRRQSISDKTAVSLKSVTPINTA